MVGPKSHRQDNSRTSARAADVSLRTEEYYRSLLPPEVVQWIILECSINMTMESTYRVYQKYGSRTVEVLTGAMALDLQQLLDAQGLKGEQHPQSWQAQYGNK